MDPGSALLRSLSGMTREARETPAETIIRAHHRNRMQTFLRDATQFLPLLLQGIKFTLIVALGSLALSTVLGLVWALMRVSGIGWLATTAKIVVNTLRGIPILVQLFYIYFVLPEFGIALSALQAAIIGLGIAYSAYQSENFRAGIEAIDHGQIEAAQSIGMGWGLTMRRVILPQAIRLVLPPYGNIMVMMLKDSSQASTITVAELTLQGTLIASSTFKNMTVYTLVALPLPIVGADASPVRAVLVEGALG